ncbi:hypothetical protein BJ741DRAFT_662578 [Chytriomyces cf. hyalinus JEL632]|nr:hypothetical protein BJ741DRAFT_662578 [Chytriomyces cf. hyalinus JEL632]
MSAAILILILATIASALPVSNGPSTASQPSQQQQYPNNYLAPFLAPLFLLVAVAGVVVATVRTVRRRCNQPVFVPPVLAYHVMVDPCDDGQVLVFGDTVQDLYNQVTQPRLDAEKQ